MQLSTAQIKERGKILQEMAEIYHRNHRYLTREQAYKAFGESIEADPIKLRFINGMAASFCKEAL
jgi:hypothetical protein